jgi:hypothetical protein
MKRTSFILGLCFLLSFFSNVNAQSTASDKKQEIQELVNNWHYDAAVANADAYFGAMTNDAIFLGTDASERWTRNEFREWSKKYFESKKTWDFKTKERHVYFSSDNKTAWWDEKLDTWMGVCAGAGVAVLTSEGWKIAHYQLAMMIPNEKVKSVQELLEPNSKPEHKE